MPDSISEVGVRFRTLVETMGRLRAADGCPWDLKQTFDSLKPYLLEETYEVLEAIDRRDWQELREELGDLLLQPVFLAQMAAEKGYFQIDDCLDAINSKLIRRHPHIFGNSKAETAEDVKKRWDEIKKEEKAVKGRPAETRSMLEDVPRSLPALVEAAKISTKAAAAGFEWPDIGGVVEKLQEEAAELAEARAGLQPEEVAHELGDLLFTMVNLARFLKVDPEQALRRANARFRERFAYIEQQLEASGKTMDKTSLEELEKLWQEGKALKASSSSRVRHG